MERITCRVSYIISESEELYEKSGYEESQDQEGHCSVEKFCVLADSSLRSACDGKVTSRAMTR